MRGALFPRAARERGGTRRLEAGRLPLFDKVALDTQHAFVLTRSKWVEWLVAQELFRRQCIARTEDPEALWFWASNQHEIDFVGNRPLTTADGRIALRPGAVVVLLPKLSGLSEPTVSAHSLVGLVQTLFLQSAVVPPGLVGPMPLAVLVMLFEDKRPVFGPHPRLTVEPTIKIFGSSEDSAI